MLKNREGLLFKVKLMSVDGDLLLGEVMADFDKFSNFVFLYLEI